MSQFTQNIALTLLTGRFFPQYSSEVDLNFKVLDFKMMGFMFVHTTQEWYVQTTFNFWDPLR